MKHIKQSLLYPWYKYGLRQTNTSCILHHLQYSTKLSANTREPTVHDPKSGLVCQKVLKVLYIRKYGSNSLIYRLQIIDSCKLTCTCDWRVWLMDQRKETCQFYRRIHMFWLILQITCKLFTNRSLYLQYDVVQPAVKLPNVTAWQHTVLISKQTYNNWYRKFI